MHARKTSSKAATCGQETCKKLDKQISQLFPSRRNVTVQPIFGCGKKLQSSTMTKLGGWLWVLSIMELQIVCLNSSRSHSFFHQEGMSLCSLFLAVARNSISFHTFPSMVLLSEKGCSKLYTEHHVADVVQLLSTPAQKCWTEPRSFHEPLALIL